jgi:hypothetical protein
VDQMLRALAEISHTYIHTHIHTYIQEDNVDQTLRALAEKSHRCDKTVAAISQQLQDVMDEHNARCVCMCVCETVEAISQKLHDVMKEHNAKFVHLYIYIYIYIYIYACTHKTATCVDSFMMRWRGVMYGVCMNVCM